MACMCADTWTPLLPFNEGCSGHNRLTPDNVGAEPEVRDYSQASGAAEMPHHIA